MEKTSEGTMMARQPLFLHYIKKIDTSIDEIFDIIKSLESDLEPLLYNDKASNGTDTVILDASDKEPDCQLNHTINCQNNRLQSVVSKLNSLRKRIAY